MKYTIFGYQSLKRNLVWQRFQLDLSSKVDPLSLLEKISTTGISQDVCVNDLGTIWRLGTLTFVQNTWIIFFVCVGARISKFMCIKVTFLVTLLKE